MLADGLTKVQGSNESLYRVLQSGMYSIRPAQEAMRLRESAKLAGQTNAELRRIGSKDKFGSCQTLKDVRTTVDPDLTPLPRAPSYD